MYLLCRETPKKLQGYLAMYEVMKHVLAKYCESVLYLAKYVI